MELYGCTLASGEVELNVNRNSYPTYPSRTAQVRNVHIHYTYLFDCFTWKMRQINLTDKRNDTLYECRRANCTYRTAYTSEFIIIRIGENDFFCGQNCVKKMLFGSESRVISEDELFIGHFYSPFWMEYGNREAISSLQMVINKTKIAKRFLFLNVIDAISAWKSVVFRIISWLI